MYPENRIKVPKADSKAKFDVVAKLKKSAAVIVNDGDPDREGQDLIDEILEYVGYKGKVGRILVSAKDDVPMKRAFDGIHVNSKFHNLYPRPPILFTTCFMQQKTTTRFSDSGIN